MGDDKNVADPRKVLRDLADALFGAGGWECATLTFVLHDGDSEQHRVCNLETEDDAKDEGDGTE